MTLGDVKNLTLHGVKMLSYLTQLFPNEFNELLCQHLMGILKELMENLKNSNKATQGEIGNTVQSQKLQNINISYKEQVKHWIAM